MGTDTTNHEISAALGEIHCFNAVLWHGLWIESPVYSLVRVIDQQWEKRILSVGIDVLRLSPVIVDKHMVKAANDEVDRSTGLDRHFMGNQLMMVPVDRIGIVGGVRWIRRREGGESIERRIRLP